MSDELKRDLQLAMPVERSEFEERARLFDMMRNMEEFLMIKNKYATGK